MTQLSDIGSVELTNLFVLDIFRVAVTNFWLNNNKNKKTQLDEGRIYFGSLFYSVWTRALWWCEYVALPFTSSWTGSNRKGPGNFMTYKKVLLVSNFV